MASSAPPRSVENGSTAFHRWGLQDCTIFEKLGGIDFDGRGSLVTTAWSTHFNSMRARVDGFKVSGRHINSVRARDAGMVYADSTLAQWEKLNFL